MIRFRFYQTIQCLLAVFIAFLQLSACSKQAPIKIGFVGGLTGTIAELGIAGRNGVMLAVEEKNSTGGINGKRIELIIKDDAQNPQTAVIADKELINEGVSAIIGHMTSAMSLAATPVINKNKVVMLSPTTSTNDLTGIEDYFFRVYPVSAGAAKRLANYAFNTHNYKTISVIYDIRNRAHSESWYTHFKNDYESLGGKITNVITYSSKPDIDFQSFVAQLTSKPCDAIFIIANSIDTALISQQVQQRKKTCPILVTEWSVAGDIVKYGGSSVEGIEFFHSFNEFSEAPAYLAFVAGFQKRFNQKPNFASAFAYEAASIVISALEKNPDATKLSQSLLDHSPFMGLQGEVAFNSFGDISRSFFLMSIQDGKIQPGRSHRPL